MNTYLRYGKYTDLEWAIDLWDGQFGAGCADGDLLGRYISDESPREVMTVVETDEDAPAGFVLYCYQTDDEFRADTHIGDDIQIAPRVAQLDVIAVDPEATGQGLGRTLTEHVQASAFGDGYDELYSISWLREGFDSSVMFENLGWERVADLPAYFEESMADCNECGGAPCRCDAALYRLRLP